MKLESIEIEKKRFLTLMAIFIITGSILLVLAGIRVISSGGSEISFEYLIIPAIICYIGAITSFIIYLITVIMKFQMKRINYVN